MRRGCFVALLALSCACRESTDVTQTVVWLEAAAGARDRMALVRVRADGPSDDARPMAETRDPKWPVKLVLAPRDDDPDRRFTLQVEALDAQGDRLMTLRFATGFVANESRYAKLVIHEDCVRTKATCDPGEECNLWRLSRAPDELSRNSAEPRVIDATCAQDPSVPAAGTGGAGAPAPMAGAGPVGGTAGGTAGTGGAGTGAAGSASPCADGYVASGTGCTDVNECDTGMPCGDHGRCQNIPGDYICQCDTGYQSRGGTCVRPGDCQVDNGGCEKTCDNASGFAMCTCDDGEWLKGDRKSCAAFGPSQRLDRGGSIAPTQPQIAVDAEGNGLAVWLETELGMSGTGTASVWTRRYIAGVGWDGMAERIETSDGGSASNARVALSANGRGVVLWIQSEDSDGDLWAVDYRDRMFGEPTRIDAENTGSVSEAAVQLDPNGNGFAAWTQTDGSRSEVWVNRYSTQDGWNSAESVDTPEPDQSGMGNQNWNPSTGSWGNWANWSNWGATAGGAFGVRVALDAHGSANVVWTDVTFGEMGGFYVVPWASRFDPKNERWRNPVRLDESGMAGMSDSQLFAESQGLAVWARTTNGRVSIRASRQRMDGGWEDSVNIATLESELNAVVPRVALSPLGSGAAIWVQSETPNVHLWANRYDGASDTWTGATELSVVETTTTPLPQIAVDPNGDGFGVWSEIKGSAREVKVARLQSDLGFIGNAVIEMDTTATPPLNSPVQIAVDPEGRAIAIWDSFEMGQYWVRAAAFD